VAAGYADPDTVRRLGRARLARFFARHSRGMWGEAKADELLAAAVETQALWAGELEYPDLAEDVAVEARLALTLTDEIKELDERIAVLLDRADPAGIIRSARPVWAPSPARPSSAGWATQDGSPRSLPPGPSRARSFARRVRPSRSPRRPDETR
jgi:hypothetical protein